MTKVQNEKGYTLIEMMVGLTISLIVLASSIALFSTNTAMGASHLQRDFLRSQLNLVADTLKVDIARAGFCFDCSSSNPFLLKGTDANFSTILIDDSATKEQGSCIRFAYNHDKRTGVVTPGRDDAMGYRKGKDPDGKPVIEIYENWGGIANWSCDSGYWRDMTYDRLNVTALSFSRKRYSATNGDNVVQKLEVNIAASLKSDSSISDAITFTVTVPNVDG